MRGVDPRALPPGAVDEVSRAAGEVMSVEDVTAGVQPANAVRVRGRLLMPADQAWHVLADRLKPSGWTPMLRSRTDAPGEELLALPVTFGGHRTRVGLPVLLFVLTVLSCLFAGAQMAPHLGDWNFNLLDGVPFAAGLLAILTAHEFGHYLVARHLESPTSLPYFIPMPIGPFGTLGAVITAGAPIRNRRNLLAIGAAGPLAGLVVALPILLVGLRLSHVAPVGPGPYESFGNSLLFGALTVLTFGRWLPSGGMDVMVHQLAFAGWAGLLVTGLNLIPAGQLDGGHITYALLGPKRAKVLSWIMIGVMAGLSFLWTGWLLWLVLLLVATRMQDMPLDDVTQLTGQQKLLAAAMLVVFVLVFVPVPLKIVP